MTEQLPFHFSLSCIGEGNGNPLQCSCLENPRDRGAWWATVYWAAQSQTRLKQLGSRDRVRTLPGILVTVTSHINLHQVRWDGLASGWTMRLGKGALSAADSVQ